MLYAILPENSIFSFLMVIKLSKHQSQWNKLRLVAKIITLTLTKQNVWWKVKIVLEWELKDCLENEAELNHRNKQTNWQKESNQPQGIRYQHQMFPVCTESNGRQLTLLSTIRAASGMSPSFSYHLNRGLSNCNCIHICWYVIHYLKH